MIPLTVPQLPERLHIALIELERFRKEHEYAPSIREMREACNVSSNSTMVRYYRQLSERGLIASNDFEARTMRITDKGRLYLLARGAAEVRETAALHVY